MQADFIEVNGAKLRASVQGEGETVLLLHGGYSNMAVWDEQAGKLAEAFRVIRYDQRGYGQSSAPDSPFSYYEDIKSVLDHYDVTETHIVASSFGGSAAIDFTLQYPQYVRKLCLIAPSVNGIRYPLRMKWEDILDFLRVNRIGIERAADLFLQKSFRSYIVPRDEARRSLFRMMYTSNSVFYQNKPVWQRPLKPLAIRRLEEIRKPMLVLEAERDHPFNQSVCSILNKRVNGAVKVMIKDAGHYPHLEKPEEVTSVLLSFLRSR